ncbi:MAG: 16S rRNA (adenine(1518)-N(6)/adenine(1519)-N(6))-dimethyltransferase RsmA [bacterium]|nr:16S rRNA (adenine(1518)-N(6)/adenine(1519)-N(6))-dimethyltransferase RsmA [bacterium]
MKAKKSLGQHFLMDEHALENIVDAGSVTKEDTVLEIGPGTGNLTKKLLNTGANVIAIEKDEELIPQLSTLFYSYIQSGQLILVTGDILKIKMADLGLKEGLFKVVANIPYYITGQVIRMLLGGDCQPQSVTLLVQREIAERVIAKDNKESLLSMSVKVFGVPKICGIIKPGAFSPPPSVDSAILTIENIHHDFFTDFTPEVFFEFLKKHFTYKRKQIGGHGHIKKEAFSICEVLPTSRPEELSKENWKCLFLNS